MVVTALMIKPGEQPCIANLCDDTEYLNAVVSIGATLVCTATVLPIEKDVVAIYAWEGVMAGLRGNRKIGKRIVAGTFYVARFVNGELCSLTDEDIAKYSYRFRKVREFDDQEVIDSWFDGPFLAE